MLGEKSPPPTDQVLRAMMLTRTQLRRKTAPLLEVWRDHHQIATILLQGEQPDVARCIKVAVAGMGVDRAYLTLDGLVRMQTEPDPAPLPGELQAFYAAGDTRISRCLQQFMMDRDGTTEAWSALYTTDDHGNVTWSEPCPLEMISGGFIDVLREAFVPELDPVDVYAEFVGRRDPEAEELRPILRSDADQATLQLLLKYGAAVAVAAE